MCLFLIALVAQRKSQTGIRSDIDCARAGHLWELAKMELSSGSSGGQTGVQRFPSLTSDGRQTRPERMLDAGQTSKITRPVGCFAILALLAATLSAPLWMCIRRQLLLRPRSTQAKTNRRARTCQISARRLRLCVAAVSLPRKDFASWQRWVSTSW